MKKKILIAAGGTGGHLYPAIGLARQLIIENPAIDILFAAGGLATNRFFNASGFNFCSIDAAALIKNSFSQCLKSCKAIVRGIWQSRKILAQYAPNLVIGFGSYHSFPILFAAQLYRYPFLLHEQNSHPGKVIRHFSKKALLTGVYFPPAREALPGPAIELAMPLREGYTLHSTSRFDAYAYFRFDPNRKTILTFGGSQGARFLNENLPQVLALQAKSSFQVLHFTGDDASTKKLQGVYDNLGIQAKVKTFEPHMNHAWSIADLAVVRAGASTIAEQIEYEVPAILIPYPLAAENHQDGNASFLVDIVKGGWKYCELNFNLPKLANTLTSLLDKHSTLLQEKKNNLKIYKQKCSRQQFSSIVHQVLERL